MLEIHTHTDSQSSSPTELISDDANISEVLSFLFDENK